MHRNIYINIHILKNEGTLKNSLLSFILFSGSIVLLLYIFG